MSVIPPTYPGVVGYGYGYPYGYQYDAAGRYFTLEADEALCTTLVSSVLVQDSSSAVSCQSAMNGW